MMLTSLKREISDNSMHNFMAPGIDVEMILWRI